MTPSATDCKFHEAHELWLKRHDSDISTGRVERSQLRMKDSELEKTINKWKWISIGFATCFSVIATGTSVLLGAGWWLLSHQGIASAILKATGGEQ